VVGASGIAEAWVIPAIRETGARVAAVCSSDPARATAYAERNGIPRAYSSLERFLGDPAVDAVYVSSTNELHTPQVLAAAAAGKPVLCEKPLATNLEDARAMVTACSRAGVVLGVNHHMRNAPTLRAMKKLLWEGAIGRPQVVRVFHVLLLPESKRRWRVSRPEAGAGAILDLTVHDADTLRFLLEDEPDEVVAISSQQGLGQGSVEDTVTGVIRFRGGVIASFHDSYTIPDEPSRVEIHGTQGSLVGVEVLRQDPAGDVVLRQGSTQSQVDAGVRENLYARHIRHFTAAVRGTGSPVATGEDGLRSVAVAVAVAESARTGTRVRVPSVF
jgi:1,5-anhydro-D-fructose reductase (1,5-anhydro-D-mannitol-forming)